MIKNITIALLIGIIIGQTCKADPANNNGAITRKDLFAAAALCGLAANSRAHLTHFQDKFVTLANSYADELMQAAP